MLSTFTSYFGFLIKIFRKCWTCKAYQWQH